MTRAGLRTTAQWMTAPVALLAMLAALLGTAAPASAARTITVACTSEAWGGPFVVAPGETVTLDGTACGQPAYLSATASGTTVGSLDPTSGGGSASIPNYGTGRAVQYTAPSQTGSDSFYVTFGNSPPYWLVQINVANAGSSAPPPWLQQYGRTSADASCIEGWDPSWSEWVFERAGGYVCQRTIYWRDNGWYVSPSAVWGVPSEVGTPWDGR